MIFNLHNTEDIKKYFQGTWIKFPRFTGDTLWYIERVNADTIEVMSDENEEALFSLKKDYEVEFIIPKKTVYQYGNTAAFLSRVPARQWKKGMNKSNTKFQILTGNNWMTAPFDIKIIKAFVNKPAYTDPYVAVKELQNKADFASAAISPRISINKGGHIFIDDVLVGKYLLRKHVITTREMYMDILQGLFPKTIIKTLSSK